MISCKEFVEKSKSIMKSFMPVLTSTTGKTPTLAIIQVGNNEASNRYVKNKIKDFEYVGAIAELHKFDDSATEEEVLTKIRELNLNMDINGIIVQLPLPNHISAKKVTEEISSIKDVDGFKNDNRYGYKPCTPLGIMNWLHTNKVDLSGKNCVVIGRSEIVGKPMAKLLLDSNATITVCHSRTNSEDLKYATRNADIIVSAVGRAKFVTADMINPEKNTIVVDVGINFDESGKMCGDVDYENVAPLAKYVTPVPSGVGLMTRISLVENVIEAFEIQHWGKRTHV